MKDYLLFYIYIYIYIYEGLEAYKLLEKVHASMYI